MSGAYDSLDPLTSQVETCEICDAVIVTMCFKGTGVCGELCRKARERARKVVLATRAKKKAAAKRKKK